LPTPSIEGLADVVVRGGRELLGIDDPLEAESWASAMLGTFYKIDVPSAARDELERTLWPAVVRKAEAMSEASGLAALEALAVVADGEAAVEARAAADRLRAAGVAAPAWADELGAVVYEGAWMVTDVFGDHEAYYATFRYPGREPHLVNALYDKALGEIIKDGFVGYFRGDPRSSIQPEPGVVVTDADPRRMARRILDAIASGDMYLDNAWTPEFKRFRALIRARMRGLPAAPAIETPEPPDDQARARLVAEIPGLTVCARRRRRDRSHHGALPRLLVRLPRRGWPALEPDRRRAVHARLPAGQGLAGHGTDPPATRRPARLGPFRAHEARPRGALDRRDRRSGRPVGGGFPSGDD
jgi:hypothetical protein